MLAHQKVPRHVLPMWAAAQVGQENISRRILERKMANIISMIRKIIIQARCHRNVGTDPIPIFLGRVISGPKSVEAE